jgi:hypothetical protein
LENAEDGAKDVQVRGGTDVTLIRREREHGDRELLVRRRSSCEGQPT